MVATKMPLKINKISRWLLPTEYTQRMMAWMALDVTVIMVAYTLVFFSRSIATKIVFVENIWFIGIATGIIAVFLVRFGVYRRIWSMTSGHDVSIILNAFLLATLVTSLIDIVLPTHPIPLSVLLIGNFVSMSVMVAFRYRSRVLKSASWRFKLAVSRELPKVDTRVLIIGAGEDGQALAWRLKHRFPKEDAYQVVGFIDDDPKKARMYVEGTKVMGTRKNIRNVVESNNIDLIVVAVHNIQGSDFREILEICEGTSARIKIAPDMRAFMSATHNTTLS